MKAGQSLTNSINPCWQSRFHTTCHRSHSAQISISGITYLFHIAGIAPGSVVITDTAVDSFFKPRFEQVILDNVVTRNTELDKKLATDLLNCSREISSFPTLIGHTMCTYDFYEGENPVPAAKAVGKC